MDDMRVLSTAVPVTEDSKWRDCFFRGKTLRWIMAILKWMQTIGEIRRCGRLLRKNGHDAVVRLPLDRHIEVNSKDMSTQTAISNKHPVVVVWRGKTSGWSNHTIQGRLETYGWRVWELSLEQRTRFVTQTERYTRRKLILTGYYPEVFL